MLLLLLESPAQNPKTTLSGYAGVLGTLLATLATALPPGQTQGLLSALGVLPKGRQCGGGEYGQPGWRAISMPN